MFRKSANPMTGEDVLGILGQIQHRQPIGALILDAQIAQDKNARGKLVSAMACGLSSIEIEPSLAGALAEVAVAEVCDSPACKKCRGTGIEFSKNENKFVECRRCAGVGRYIPSQRELHQMVCYLMPTELAPSKYQFDKKWYDIFMACVDSLHQAASRAGSCARTILDACSNE